MRAASQKRSPNSGVSPECKRHFITQKQCHSQELTEGDCWIGMTQASSSGLILAARVGKQSKDLIEELIVSTEGKTDCRQWHTDDWGGYEPVFPPEVKHIIGKDQTQQFRAN